MLSSAVETTGNGDEGVHTAVGEAMARMVGRDEAGDSTKQTHLLSCGLGNAGKLTRSATINRTVVG